MPMRRFLAAALAVAYLLCFSGCASGRRGLQAGDLDFTFSCKADIESGGSRFTCAVSRAGKKNASVRVLSGGTAGLAFFWNGDGFAQTYCGLSAKSSSCPLPEGSFARVLVNVLDAAEEPDALEKTESGKFSGKAENMDFTLTAGEKTGLIETVSVPDWQFTAKLYDYEGTKLPDILPENCTPG
jgi:hypothetical protein